MTSRARPRRGRRVKDLGKDLSSRTALLSINPAWELISRWRGTRGPPFGEKWAAREPTYFRSATACTERIKSPPLPRLSPVNRRLKFALLSGASVTYLYVKVAMPGLCQIIFISYDCHERRTRADRMRYYLKYDIRRYILRRVVITPSQSLPYSPCAIIPRDKCNLHIICRASSADRLRHATTSVSSHAGIRCRKFLPRCSEEEREITSCRSLLGKSCDTVNRAADYSLCNLSSVISNVKHVLNGTLTLHTMDLAANRTDMAAIAHR